MGAVPRKLWLLPLLHAQEAIAAAGLIGSVIDQSCGQCIRCDLVGMVGLCTMNRTVVCVVDCPLRWHRAVPATPHSFHMS